MRAIKKCTQPNNEPMAIEMQIQLRSNFIVATGLLFIGLIAGVPSVAQLQLPDVLTEHLKSDDYARILLREHVPERIEKGQQRNLLENLE